VTRNGVVASVGVHEPEIENISWACMVFAQRAFLSNVACARIVERQTIRVLGVSALDRQRVAWFLGGENNGSAAAARRWIRHDGGASKNIRCLALNRGVSKRQ